MAHDLAGEVVQEVGVLVISDVVEVDETAENVVFEPRLGRRAGPEADELGSAGAQVLQPQLIGRRLIIEAARSRLNGLRPERTSLRGTTMMPGMSLVCSTTSAVVCATTAARSGATPTASSSSCVGGRWRFATS